MTKRETQSWEKIVACVFGFVFFCVILVLNVFIPHPTPTQHETFKIVLALSAVGLGAVLPGFLNIQGKFFMLTIRAGGALALFVLVYFFPPSTPSNNPPKKSTLEIHQSMKGDGGVQLGENNGTININPNPNPNPNNTRLPSTDTNP